MHLHVNTNKISTGCPVDLEDLENREMTWNLKWTWITWKLPGIWEYNTENLEFCKSGFLTL